MAGSATVVGVSEGAGAALSLPWILADLADRDIARLMVEGAAVLLGRPRPVSHHRSPEDVRTFGSAGNPPVCRSRYGRELDAANVRREFRTTIKAPGIAGAWTPRELRHWQFASCRNAVNGSSTTGRTVC